MDSNSSEQQPIYRKIKQRLMPQNRVQNTVTSTTTTSTTTINNNNIIINNNNKEYHSRSWFTPLNSKSSKENNLIEQPTVKILAKSSNKAPTTSNISDHLQTNLINSTIDITTQMKTTSVLTKPRPSVAILEKNIQVALKLPVSLNIKNATAVEQRRESRPKYIKVVDFEFNFIQQETSTIDLMFMPDPISSASSNQSTLNANLPSATQTNGQQIGFFGRQSFCIVAAVGLDGSGKSSLLNSIAQCDVFQTRYSMAEKNRECPLNHVTSGIDLHITNERVFLLDTQPLLSASVLDELIRINMERFPGGSGPSGMSGIGGSSWKHFYNSTMSTPIFSSVVGFDIAETENFAFIYSLQMLTFLITICDHVVLVIDSLTLDAHLFKLLATAMMMVGDAVMSKANIIIYLKNTSSKKLDHNNCKLGSLNESQLGSTFKQAINTLLGSTVNVEFINDDESLLTTTVLRPPYSRSLVNHDQSCSAISYQTERLWFHSVQRFWETSIRKSSLFADYARYLP